MLHKQSRNIVFLVGPSRAEDMSLFYGKVSSSMLFYWERDKKVSLIPKSAISNDESLLDIRTSTTATAEDYRDNSSQSQDTFYMIREVKIRPRPPVSSTFQTSHHAVVVVDDDDDHSIISSRISKMWTNLAQQRHSYDSKKMKKELSEVSRPMS